MLSSDSLVTIHRARGEWNYPSDHVLAGLCRGLAQANEVFGIAPWQDLSHVPAHSGFGWNEYADVLAKLAVETSTVCTSVPDVSCWLTNSSFQHLWLLLAAHLQPHLWPTFLGASITTGQGAVASDLPAERYFGCEHFVPGPAGDPRWAHIHIVSMNVQTLEGEGVQHEEGRVGFLRDQMLVPMWRLFKKLGPRRQRACFPPLSFGSAVGDLPQASLELRPGSVGIRLWEASASVRTTLW